MATDLVRARYGDLKPARGGYESYYLAAHHPSEPRAVWVRYTVLKRPNAEPTGATWITAFGPDGVRATRAAGTPASKGWIAIGDATLEAGRAAGSIDDAAWELCFDDATGIGAHAHLPYAWMYRAPLPKTKPVTLHPSATFSGSFTIDGATTGVDGWQGMVGHNWGAEHATQWIWLYGTGFDDAGVDTWLDVVLGRITIAGRTTPWVANGTLALDGTRHRLGGLDKVRATQVEPTPTGADLTLPAKPGPVRVQVSSPVERVAAWRYADPPGGEHHVFNGSTADLLVQAGERTLTLTGGAAYEFGTHPGEHGVPLLPFGADA